MTARYTDAEKAAAKRIGYEAVLQGDPPSLAGWVDGFRDTVVATYNDNARYYRTRAARLRRMAEKAARQQEVYVALSVKGANDARLVARAVAREQRKAARS